MSDRELLEPVEVVGYLNGSNLLTADAGRMFAAKYRNGFEPLMTVAQHKRILAAQPQSDASWWALVMCAAAELETASYSINDPEAKRIAQSGAEYFRNRAKEMDAAMRSKGDD